MPDLHGVCLRPACRHGFEHEGALGQAFHNPYEAIKLESEIALRESCRRMGVDLQILRPSVVIGAEAETQGAHPSSLLFQFIRLTAAFTARADGAAVDVRTQGRPAAHFNIVPIEYVSAAIEALMDRSAATSGTFQAGDLKTTDSAGGIANDHFAARCRGTATDRRAI